MLFRSPAALCNVHFAVTLLGVEIVYRIGGFEKLKPSLRDPVHNFNPKQCNSKVYITQGSRISKLYFAETYLVDEGHSNGRDEVENQVTQIS